MSQAELPVGEKSPHELFEDGLRRILQVTPEELKRREAAWEVERRASGKQKPGPKPKGRTLQRG